jgi:hypothetical protein
MPALRPAAKKSGRMNISQSLSTSCLILNGAFHGGAKTCPRPEIVKKSDGRIQTSHFSSRKLLGFNQMSGSRHSVKEADTPFTRVPAGRQEKKAKG